MYLLLADLSSVPCLFNPGWPCCYQDLQAATECTCEQWIQTSTALGRVNRKPASCPGELWGPIKRIPTRYSHNTPPRAHLSAPNPTPFPAHKLVARRPGAPPHTRMPGAPTSAPPPGTCHNAYIGRRVARELHVSTLPVMHGWDCDAGVRSRGVPADCAARVDMRAHM